jgi:ABC-type sugar transport system substrate-binding protein
MKKVFIVVVSVLAVGLLLVSCGKKKEDSKVYIGVSISSLENEYWASLAKGAELVAKSLPEGSAEVVIMTAREADKQMANIESFITKYGDKGIMFVDPITGSITPTIAEMCEEAHVYYSNYANRDPNLYPTKYKYFTVFLTQDDINSGYMAAKDLFDSIGGKGNVAELRGVLGNDSAAKRNGGFEKALLEYPDIKVLDAQVANYVTSEAFTITQQWITKYGNTLNAIYTHNDDMAIGAIEALKQQNLTGTVKVSGFDGTSAAFAAIKEGTMHSTIFNNGFLVGGYGTAYAYAARTGKIDTKTIDQSKRMFYSKVELVKSDNVDRIIDDYVKSTPTFDFNNLDYPILGKIPNPSL